MFHQLKNVKQNKRHNIKRNLCQSCKFNFIQQNKQVKQSYLSKPSKLKKIFPFLACTEQKISLIKLTFLIVLFNFITFL